MQFPVLTPEEREKLLTPPLGKVDVVIDSDTYNEVDDQFAIAYALRSPERLNVQAIYAAPFTSMQLVGMVPEATGPAIGMDMSYKEILHLMELMGEDPTGRVFRGSESYLPDAHTPVESEAARDLVKRAMEAEGPLYVLAIGAITNVASAILMEPEILRKITVVWLGGQPTHYPYAIEFNLMQDLHASRLMFECGVALVHIPCMGVASHLTTTPAELKENLTGSPIGEYLTKIVTDACVERDFPPEAIKIWRETYMKDIDDYPDEIVYGFRQKGRKTAFSRIIWDISTVGYMVNPNWCPSTLQPSPVLNGDMSWAGQKTEAENRHPIRVVRHIQRDPVFGDMFQKLQP